MATASFCDLCSEENKSSSATKFCSDCDERLCTDCTKSHFRFKAFKLHHVIDLSTVSSNIPISAKKACNVDPDMLLDYYCTDHESMCCRACIPDDHRKCRNVLPLEHASKDVKQSALFIDIMANIKHLIKTLNDLHHSRESNLQSLCKTKSDITKQIREVKSRLLKQIDDLERDLHAKLSSIHLKHEIKIDKQKVKITQVLDSLKATENEIDFLKDHGSNNQLFYALHKHTSIIKSAEVSVEQMVSSSHEIDIAFHALKDLKIDVFGQLSETVKPCQVQYKSHKIQQAQIMTEQLKRIVKLEKDTEIKLKTRLKFLKDMAITVDNKLLLTKWSTSDPKLYVYRDCDTYETEIILSSKPYGIVVVPGTERAIVTLPDEKSIQFIDTKEMTKDSTVNVGFTCYGITAGHDRIYVGGQNGTIKTLDTNGTILQSIKQGSDVIYFILYDKHHEQFIVRYFNKLICIDMDGKQVYCKSVTGTAGVTRDIQGNIYYSGYIDNNIQRLSPDGENSEEILNHDNGIYLAWGICFNNDFTKFFVINNNCTSVFAYNCIY